MITSKNIMMLYERNWNKLGIVEEAPKSTSNKEFYIPHKGIVKELSETTKLRVVYDASAKSDPASPSLKDCLYAVPPLQNRLWDVLVQQRAFPVMVSSDIRQGFPTNSSEGGRERRVTLSLGQE